MGDVIKEAFAYDGPVLVNVIVDPDQPIIPRQANYKTPEGQMASRPLEDMKPLLDPEEIKEIMSVSL
jgi:acetolactate synthase-1/2/3 large subunit